MHHDFYYDDIESKSFRTHAKRRARPWKYRTSGSEQYYGWKDVDGTDYKGDDSGEDEDDYTGVFITTTNDDREVAFIVSSTTTSPFKLNDQT